MASYLVHITSAPHLPYPGRREVKVRGQICHFEIDKVTQNPDQSISVRLSSIYDESVTAHMIQQTLDRNAQILKVIAEGKIGNIV
jgi:hypothetical protein